MYHVIVTFHASAAASPILRIPKAVSFSILPFSMVLVIIRTVQECIRLSKEEEKALGLGKPTFDVDALEREYLDRVQMCIRDSSTLSSSRWSIRMLRHLNIICVRWLMEV